MHTVPLQLPLKASEAGALAGLVIEQCHGRKLTDDLRNRLGARVLGLRLSSITPYIRSLERDPIHPSTWYLAVDTRGPHPESLLLRIALESSPASGLFPNALLIGRMRIHTGEEAVVNAIGFSPADRAGIRTFAEQVNPGFLPRPRGPAPAIALDLDDPAAGLPLAFDAWRGILRTNGVNLASVMTGAAIEDLCDTAIWAAIRAGWREGYGIEVETDSIERASGCTKFAVSLRDLAGAELDRAVELYDGIRSLRKEFDFELAFEGASVTVEDVASGLHFFKAQGRPVQFLRPAQEPARFADVARQFGAVLTLTDLEGITLRRANYALRATGDPAPLILQAAERFWA